MCVCVCVCINTYGSWMIEKIFVRAHRMARNVGFLQNLGSLVRLFLCEAISKCYSNSLKGPKCHNKQGIENLLCFLMCAESHKYVHARTHTHTHTHTHTQYIHRQHIHTNTLCAWRTPWTEEPGGLWSMAVAKNQILLSN